MCETNETNETNEEKLDGVHFPHKELCKIYTYVF